MTESLPRRNLLIFLCVTAGVLALDQAVKAIIVFSLSPGESLSLIPRLISITNLRNPGAAFGIFKGSSQIVFWSAVVIVVLTLLWFYQARHKESPWPFTALGLMIGGALGNLVDRIFRGAVVDYIDVGPWPVFNAADIAIVAGVIIIVGVMLGEYRRSKKEEARGERG